MCLTPRRPEDPAGTPSRRPEDPATPSGRLPVAGRGATGVVEGSPGDAYADVSMLVTPLHPGSAARRARAFVREVLQREGIPGDDIADAEMIAAELAANCERHGRPSYEMRVFILGGVPTWCEVVDSDPDLCWIPAVLDRPRVQTALDLFSESNSTLLTEDGRGLLLVRELSQGHCRAYLTTTFATDAPAKAIAFALPSRSGTRLTCPPLLHLGRHRAHLRP